jgi:hypothetical protein
MDSREIWSRAVSAGRREAGHLAYLARKPQWRRGDTVRVLRHDMPALAPAIAALEAGDWMSAHEALMLHVATRGPGFLLDPGARSQRVATVHQQHPTALAAAIYRGDRVAAGRLDLLGYQGLTFQNGGRSGDIDWRFDPVHQRHAPHAFWSRVSFLEATTADHKVVWELNRHQSWLMLGRAYWLSDDDRYRRAFVTQFDSWMRDNPPLSGMNWASMLELGLRSISWLWALHFFALAPRPDDGVPWAVDLLLGIDRQLTLVEQNLSRYFSPNTHLLGEALALYAVGRSLPELRHARRWEHVGRDVLIEQMSAQVHRDGGHAELSTHYHRYTLDFYLLALAVARQTSDPAEPAFAGAVERLAHYARTMSDDTGRLPGIGDDDGGSLFPICGRDVSDIGDSLQLAAQLLDEPSLAVGAPAEEVTWMTGVAPAAAAATAWPSTALPDSGYFVSRSPRGDHLTIDAGRHGFLSGGHAHADALAVTLTVRGRPFLIDPGTGCYTVDPNVRDRFRSTRFHNTLTLDGRPQSVPAGPFQWHSTAHATAHEWRSGSDGDAFAGSHDGYAPLIHHRAVLARPGCWVVVDRVIGSGPHNAEAHWHLDPAWHAARAGRGVVKAQHPDGTTLWILSLDDESEVFRGSTDPYLGWCAPVYGPVLPTSTVRIRRSADAPFDIVTVIVDARNEPRVERRTHAGAGRGAIELSVNIGGVTESEVFPCPTGLTVNGAPFIAHERTLEQMETRTR